MSYTLPRRTNPASNSGFVDRSGSRQDGKASYYYLRVRQEDQMSGLDQSGMGGLGLVDRQLCVSSSAKRVKIQMCPRFACRLLTLTVWREPAGRP